MFQASAYDQRDELIMEHLGLAEFVARRMRPQTPVSLFMDELKSAAMHGLMEAAARFDPSREIMFKTFAEPRIRGAIRDELRKMDWFSRSMRDKHNRVTKETKHLEQKLGRKPSEEETAEAMDMDLDDYRQLLEEVGRLGIVSLHEVSDASVAGSETAFFDQIEDKHGANPEEILDQKQLAQHFADVLDRLPEKERLVVTLFCFEGFTQKEIAATLKLSKGRISQLYHQAVTEPKAGFSRPGVSFGKKAPKHTHTLHTSHTHKKEAEKRKMRN